MVITSALAPWFISSWLELLLGLRARSMVITSALAPWFISSWLELLLGLGLEVW